MSTENNFGFWFHFLNFHKMKELFVSHLFDTSSVPVYLVTGPAVTHTWNLTHNNLVTDNELMINCDSVSKTLHVHIMFDCIV